jgi:hypothetical protein
MADSSGYQVGNEETKQNDLAHASGRLGVQSRTFQMTAQERGGQRRTATSNGTLRQAGHLNANVSGPVVNSPRRYHPSGGMTFCAFGPSSAARIVSADFTRVSSQACGEKNAECGVMISRPSAHGSRTR